MLFVACVMVVMFSRCQHGHDGKELMKSELWQCEDVGCMWAVSIQPRARNRKAFFISKADSSIIDEGEMFFIYRYASRTMSVLRVGPFDYHVYFDCERAVFQKKRITLVREHGLRLQTDNSVEWVILDLEGNYVDFGQSIYVDHCPYWSGDGYIYVRQRETQYRYEIATGYCATSNNPSRGGY